MQIPLLERHSGTFSFLVLLCLYLLKGRATLVHVAIVFSTFCFVVLYRSQAVAGKSLKRLHDK